MKGRLSSCSVRMENNLFFLILNSLGDYAWRRKVSLSKYFPYECGSDFTLQ